MCNQQFNNLKSGTIVTNKSKELYVLGSFHKRSSNFKYWTMQNVDNPNKVGTLSPSNMYEFDIVT